MTWSQTTPTVPGAPEVPLRALAEIASLPDPTEDAVRRVLPAAQPDADNTVAVLTGLFRGETPPTPAATRKRPLSSLAAFGLACTFVMSL